MALVDGSSEFHNGEDAVVVLIGVCVVSLTLTLKPLNMFFSGQPDDEIDILPGLLSMDIDTALNILASKIVEFVEFHIDVEGGIF